MSQGDGSKNVKRDGSKNFKGDGSKNVKKSDFVYVVRLSVQKTPVLYLL